MVLAFYQGCNCSALAAGPVNRHTRWWHWQAVDPQLIPHTASKCQCPGSHLLLICIAGCSLALLAQSSCRCCFCA
jgi:hypothetical protein